MTVRRFIGNLVGQLEVPDGDWVTWEDHSAEFERWQANAAKLSAEIDRLTAEIADVIGCNERVVAEMERRTEWANAKINELTAEIERLRAALADAGSPSSGDGVKQ